jgi:hypothetical protein
MATTSTQETLPGACSNPEGGACLGPLEAGTYETSVFEPQITYLVPEGWANYEDLPGNFLLVPPGDDLAGVNAGTSDYIGVYSSIATADAGCEEQAAPGVGTSPSEIAAELTGRLGLTTTAPSPVSVGGLDGVVFDIRLAEDWSDVCPFAPDLPLVPLIIGVPPSSLHHVMIPELTLRLYLLDRSGSTLAIEVNDASDGGQNLDGYSSIVDQFTFGD